MIRILFLTIIFLNGCVSVNPQQHLIDNTDAPQMGICSSQWAVLSRSLVNEDSYFDPDNISILNWNVQKNQAHNWLDDFKSFSEKQDIVVIQEAHLDSHLQNALDQQALHWSLNAAFYLREKPTGVLTASPVKPHYSCGYRVQEPVIRIPKSVLINYYRIKGFDASLMVANIHGINFTLGTEAYRSQIDKLMEIAQAHDGPMIIAGDFNSWSDERAAILAEMVKSLSLKTCDVQPSNQTQVFGKVIDHIFYRGLQPIFQESKKVTTSDHNPMRIRFRLANDENRLAKLAQ